MKNMLLLFILKLIKYEKTLFDAIDESMKIEEETQPTNESRVGLCDLRLVMCCCSLESHVMCFLERERGF